MKQFDKKAIAFVLCYRREVLLYLRKGGGFLSLWDCGGGEWLEGESLELGLQRLLKEYYELEPDDYTPQVNMPNTYFKSGDIIWRITLNIILVKDQSKPKAGKPDEMGELRWFPFEEIPLDSLHPGFEADLKAFMDIFQLFLSIGSS